MTTQQIVIPIKGMTCASCVQHVEHGLAETRGVEKATVNLATERATVRYDPQRATLPDLVWHVRDTGYDVLTDAVDLPLEGAGDSARIVEALRATPGVLEWGKKSIRLREMGCCMFTGILLLAKAVRVKPLPAATVLNGS